MGFSTQEYCSGQPFPSPGDLSDPGMERASSAGGASKEKGWELITAPPLIQKSGCRRERKEQGAQDLGTWTGPPPLRLPCGGCARPLAVRLAHCVSHLGRVPHLPLSGFGCKTPTHGGSWGRKEGSCPEGRQSQGIQGHSGSHLEA